MIGIATTDLSYLQAVDADQPFVEAALARAGLHGRYLHWDDPSVDWSACELVVLRSPWNYPQHLDAFLGWLAELPAPVFNPPATVRWNCDKRYLAELAASGVPVVPTGYATDGPSWLSALAEVTSAQLVVKPTVSVGSNLTGRFETGDPAAGALAEQIWAAGKVAMVQPYVESVGTDGELAVLHLDGEFSHAVRKGPLLEVGGGLLGGTYTEVLEPVAPSIAQLAAADAVLAALPAAVGESLLYSRVDLMTADDGTPVLLELELIEPSLFFSALPGDAHSGDAAAAADRFAAAVATRLTR